MMLFWWERIWQNVSLQFKLKQLEDRQMVLTDHCIPVVWSEKAECRLEPQLPIIKNNWSKIEIVYFLNFNMEFII